MSKGTLRLYGCGGTGINLTSHFHAGREEVGCATVAPVYVDTSRSNLAKSGITTDDRCFILKDTDGSGKVRRDNHDSISKNIKQMLQQHAPGDFNVVVFSASGGSGSVFGPLILSELLTRGLPAIAVVIGSHESAITAENSINTLKSLDGIAKTTGIPVVMYYDQNDPEVKRSEVDKSALAMIGSLGYLTSGDNAELDTRDLLNWVQFHRTTSVKACLATVNVMVKTAGLEEEIANPISIASLYRSPDDRDLTTIPEYHTEGYPNEKIGSFEHTNAIHFVISTDEVGEIYKAMQLIAKGIDTKRKSRVVTESLVNDDDNMTDQGLVL
jgi:hypothetical protein